MRRCAVVITLILLAWSCEGAASDLAGQASVIDGDTLEIHGTRIRVFGIDAPESDQLCRDEDSNLYRCGQKAAAQNEAKQKQRGMWRGSFKEPWVYRACRRSGGRPVNLIMCTGGA